MLVGVSFSAEVIMFQAYLIGHFRYPSVQRYVHDLSTEMGEHIDNITSTLSMFIEVGMARKLFFLSISGNTNRQGYPLSDSLKNMGQTISSTYPP